MDKVVKTLSKKFKVEPWREDPFKVLVSTILSQRTKDEVTEKASQKLLAKADSPSKMLKLRETQIAKLIYPVGFYKQKAKKLKLLCKLLVEKYGGKVPSREEELLKLPGVGDKTAACVLCYGFGKATIPVDTHVNRIAQRLGWVPKGSTPEKTRKILDKLIPNNLKVLVNFTFIEFGKKICKPRKPLCAKCPISSFCLMLKEKTKKNLK